MLSQSRAKESYEIVQKLHADPTDPEHAHALQEFYQMSQQVEVDAAAWKSGGGYRQLFAKASFRKRMITGIYTQFAVQSTGDNVVYRKCQTSPMVFILKPVLTFIFFFYFCSLHCQPLQKFGIVWWFDFDSRCTIRDSCYWC